MNKAIVVGAVCVVTVFAGVMYFAREPAESPAAVRDPTEKPAPTGAEQPEVAPPSVPEIVRPVKPVPSDPRLAALMASPAGALIEVVAGADGKVTQELDNDPGSPSYRKPLREYRYAGERVVALVSYQYVGSQTQIIRTMVTYKPDGGVHNLQESTSYEERK